MMLSEAAKTGRKFWRRSDPDKFYALVGTDIFSYSRGSLLNTPDGELEVNAEMLVASDWEAEPRSVTITAKDLRQCIVLFGSKARRPDEIVAHIIEELELDG